FRYCLGEFTFNISFPKISLGFMSRFMSFDRFYGNENKVEPMVAKSKAPIEPAITSADPLFEPIQKISKPARFMAPARTADLSHEEMQPARTPRFSQSTILPKLSLLDSRVNEKKSGVSKDELERRSREVEECFNDFGVALKVVAAHPGPVVTRYEMELAPG
ncbi:MAG: DNA translocase FtsK, partial [Gammaproteobacteria bacterium]|nr:DNA translocase FtsK [Gammaproteobacteria bacterium]